jgi:hypothetical protein
VGRLIALLAGGFGAFAFFRRRRRRGEAPEVSPAEELKAKLAESRAPEPEAEPEVEPEPEAEPVLESDLQARRREVHERARGAIDELS